MAALSPASARAAAPAAARSISRRLAEYWSAASLDDLPADVVAAAKRFLLDTLAAGTAGGGEAVVDTVARGARAAAGAGESVLWGRPERLAPAAAALVNGTAAHALELDDFGGCGHSGAVVVAAVSALASAGPVSGREVLLAVVAGYDLASRVLVGSGGYRPHNEHGWHSTGTCGTFGAAAACAKLLGLPADSFTNALGIAGTFTGGLWAFLEDGALVKRFHPGKAAETGLSAALMAEAGLTGPERIFEAEWGGFYPTYAPGFATPGEATERLGADFHIHRSGIKPYACCRTLHSAVEGMLDIMREAPAGSAAIERIVVHGNAQTRRQFARKEIGNLLEAQFSAAYALAVAATSGRATIDQFSPLRTGDPEVRRLIACTSIEADRELGATGYPSVEVLFADGGREYRDIPFAKGAPEAPLSDDELEAKATGLMAPVIGRRGAGEVVRLIGGLEDIDDFSRVLSLLSRPS